MKDYVLREDVLRCVEEAGHDNELDLGYPDHNEAFQEIIKDIPTADVVEVRHGRWERVDYGNGCYNYHCSSCRHIPRENIRSNYCPNCGADMRGGVNDG